LKRRIEQARSKNVWRRSANAQRSIALKLPTETGTISIEQSSKFLNAARFYTVLITIVAVGLYFWLSILTEGYVVTYLYVFYSAQLSLLPSVIHALLRKRTNKYAALTSLIVGFSVSVYTGVKVSSMEAEYSVLTPLLCIISAFASYYMADFFRKER
jgi:Na+/proline symporter